MKMRTAKEIVKFCPINKNWQLQGPVTFKEFIHVKLEILRIKNTDPNYLYNKQYWDNVVVTESLYRDRRGISTRFNKLYRSNYENNSHKRNCQ